ncbi:MAG: (5-formylfuran-3-yl)methyl phosphate synthase [Planctomycetaceae bacterium]|nr:(5-formylfuran-3-yl)methyl phosphate synthase [Planctomycetaceae bacterium]
MTKLRFPLKNSPQLLVSVRDAMEVRAALEGGADIIDIKEPQNGSLGMAADSTIEQIIQTIQTLDEHCPLSVALGELLDWQETPSVTRLPIGVDYVKLGFSGCGSALNWRDQWKEFRHLLRENSPTSPEWVAVIYADWQAADALLPQEILEAAFQIPCAAVLIDTFHKTGQSLLDILSPSELGTLANQVHQLGLPLAVAGSLKIENLPRLAPLLPEIIAIRSAACVDRQRGGSVCASAVRNFKKHIVSSRPVQLPRIH